MITLLKRVPFSGLGGLLSGALLKATLRKGVLNLPGALVLGGLEGLFAGVIAGLLFACAFWVLVARKRPDARGNTYLWALVGAFAPACLALVEALD